MAERRKVLLIDDDPDFVAANRIALEASGFTVVTASNSRDGAEAAVREQPDVIVADLMMEEMHAGFALVEELMHRDSTSAIPIIMVTSVTTETGFRVDQDGSRPEWLHVREFINKPVDPLTLVRRVSAALE